MARLAALTLITTATNGNGTTLYGRDDTYTDMNARPFRDRLPPAEFSNRAERRGQRSSSNKREQWWNQK
jgi:hypothetical protein